MLRSLIHKMGAKFTMHSCTTHTPHTHTAPSAPPVNVTSHSLSSTSIRVLWDEVPVTERNGIVTGYEVEYRQMTFSSIEVTQTMETEELSITLPDLQEYTEYSIRVRAYTSEGPGPYSNETVTLTHEDSE